MGKKNLPLNTWIHFGNGAILVQSVWSDPGFREVSRCREKAISKFTNG